ncbi:MAG TPA: hypothetical protein DCX92_06765 [Bacteroidetes bacterium]|nr:hypothetical protein [Bacteroidota bacterium]
MELTITENLIFKNMNNTTAIPVSSTTLEYKGVKTIIFQLVLISIAVLSPYIAHAFSAPVRYILPMHWAVILAALVYGWRGGAVTGVLAPVSSFFISGMPAGIYLAAMVPELFVYGIITGLLREKFRMNAFVSVAAALIAGRIVFVMVFILSGNVQGSISGHLSDSMMPGLAAALLQILILPFAAKWWINAERD